MQYTVVTAASFGGTSAIGDVVNGLATHVDVIDAVLAGLDTLRALALDEALGVELVERSCIEAVMKCLRRHNNNTPVVELGIAVFKNMASKSGAMQRQP